MLVGRMEAVESKVRGRGIIEKGVEGCDNRVDKEASEKGIGGGVVEGCIDGDCYDACEEECQAEDEKGEGSGM